MHISSLHYIHTHTLTVGWEISSGSLLSVLQWHDIEGALSSATYDISIHVCFQLFVVIRKIHIGYVLKSADIRTLVASMYLFGKFINHPTHIPAQTHAYLHTPEHKRAYQSSPMHTHPVRENLCTPAYTPNIPTHPLI